MRAENCAPRIARGEMRAAHEQRTTTCAGPASNEYHKKDALPESRWAFGYRREYASQFSLPLDTSWLPPACAVGTEDHRGSKRRA